MVQQTTAAAILSQREVIIILVSSVVVFLILWRITGYFAGIYFDSIKSDIRKLFDLVGKIEEGCKKCSYEIGKLSGNKK